jgi:hypothetical protein
MNGRASIWPEMKEIIKYLKNESYCLHEVQILLQVQWDKWEVKFISTLHTADIVVTEKKNWKGEKWSQK